MDRNEQNFLYKFLTNDVRYLAKNGNINPEGDAVIRFLGEFLDILHFK